MFTTAGTGFQVSANAVNPTNTPVLFGNINPTYPGLFQTGFPDRYRLFPIIPRKQRCDTQRPKCSRAVLGVTSATASGPAYYSGSIPFAL